MRLPSQHLVDGTGLRVEPDVQPDYLLGYAANAVVGLHCERVSAVRLDSGGVVRHEVVLLGTGHYDFVEPAQRLIAGQLQHQVVGVVVVQLAQTLDLVEGDHIPYSGTDQQVVDPADTQVW